jgi:hypothetical protein
MKKIVVLAALAFALAAMPSVPQRAYACSTSDCATPEEAKAPAAVACASPEPAPVQVAAPCDNRRPRDPGRGDHPARRRPEQFNHSEPKIRPK